MCVIVMRSFKVPTFVLPSHASPVQDNMATEQLAP